ncbi:MAG: efflux RND transporter permease subunit [Acidobacteriota bacterium]
MTEVASEPSPSPQAFERVLSRGRLVILASALLAAAGLLAMLSLPRDLFPDLSLPSIQVLIQSPGRDATELELGVARPLEQALQGLPNARRVVTTIQPGVVQTVIAFDTAADPFRSRLLVAEKVASIAAEFPEGTSLPLLTSAAGRLQEIQELVLEGPAIDPMKLRDAAVQIVVPRLQSVRGVARIELLGGEDRQLQITVQPERMRLTGVSLEEVVAALDGSERDRGAGILSQRDKLSFVTYGGLAASPEQVRRLPVRAVSGMVPLGDVADVRESPGFRMGLARYRGFEVVSMRVVKQPTADTLAVARGVRALVPELQRALPPGMTLGLFYDQGALVTHALGGVGEAVGIGGIFVALVLIVLLGNLRASAIVLLLLPLAILGSALLLLGFGEGLNAMTLGGLAIAVGLLVDAGVIMVENVAHRLAVTAHDRGRRATIAAAAKEVAAPIATAILVILAVFIPLLVLGGVAGKLYAPLAVAVASALAISLVLALTLVPVLAERFMPSGTELREPWLVGRIKRFYRPLLAWALQHGTIVQVASAALALPAIILAIGLGTDFLPALNEGALLVQTFLPSDASLAAVDSANRQFEDRLLQVEGVKAAYRRTGRGELTEDPMPHYSSDVLITLEAGADSDVVAHAIGEIAEEMPFTAEITTPMGMRIAEGIGGTPADIQVEIYHPDLAALAAREAEIRARLAGVEGVKTVSSDTGAPLPRWRVIPDDDALRRLEVPRTVLLTAISAALQGIELPPRYQGLQRIERIVRFPDNGRLTAEALAGLPLVLAEGRVVELGQVARLEEAPTPSMIRRKNGQRRLGFNLAVGQDLGGTATRVERALREIDLPPGATFALSGKVEEARETQRRLGVATAVALTLVLLLLGAALGRAREVAVVIATLPVAFAGGLYALWIAGETWNASSIVGLIGLFGVAVQNSLVLIAQTRGLLAAGVPFEQAIREASVGRVRPKLMTAGAAILGLLPMLFGLAGSELERPLAIVMVGGLVTSTAFTLLVLPSVYARFARPASGPAIGMPGDLGKEMS